MGLHRDSTAKDTNGIAKTALQTEDTNGIAKTALQNTISEIAKTAPQNTHGIAKTAP